MVVIKLLPWRYAEGATFEEILTPWSYLANYNVLRTSNRTKLTISNVWPTFESRFGSSSSILLELYIFIEFFCFSYFLPRLSPLIYPPKNICGSSAVSAQSTAGNSSVPLQSPQVMVERDSVTLRSVSQKETCSERSNYRHGSVPEKETLLNTAACNTATLLYHVEVHMIQHITCEIDRRGQQYIVTVQAACCFWLFRPNHVDKSFISQILKMFMAVMRHLQSPTSRANKVLA